MVFNPAGGRCFRFDAVDIDGGSGFGDLCIAEVDVFDQLVFFVVGVGVPVSADGF
jgi:hypothetical protein